METLIMEKIEYTDFIKFISPDDIIRIYRSLYPLSFPKTPFKARIIDKESMIEMVSGLKGIVDVRSKDCDGLYVLTDGKKSCAVPSSCIEPINGGDGANSSHH